MKKAKILNTAILLLALSATSCGKKKKDEDGNNNNHHNPTIGINSAGTSTAQSNFGAFRNRVREGQFAIASEPRNYSSVLYDIGNGSDTVNRQVNHDNSISGNRHQSDIPGSNLTDFKNHMVSRMDQSFNRLKCFKNVNMIGAITFTSGGFEQNFQNFGRTYMNVTYSCVREGMSPHSTTAYYFQNGETGYIVDTDTSIGQNPVIIIEDAHRLNL